MAYGKAKRVCPRYSLGEEIGNAVSHGVGALLGLTAIVLMLLKSVNVWQTVSAIVYGGSIVVLFTMSCLYHSLTNEKARYVMRVFDHTSIFLLIAGTYTPYTLITLHGTLGWILFAAVWACAVVGITLNAISIERFKVFSMIAYIASGWCVVIAIVPLIRNLEAAGWWLLLAGGVLYTVGILFYRRKNVRWFHMIWHLFVLAAAICQFLSIYLYVIG